MSGWLLDTNVVAELASRHPDAQVLQWLRCCDEHCLFLSVLTLAEYDQGLCNLAPDNPARPRIEADIRALELRFAGRVLPTSDNVVRRWGRLAGDIRRTQGRPPPVVDTLIAATAIEHGLVLVTRNVKDVAGTGVQLLNPWQ